MSDNPNWQRKSTLRPKWHLHAGTVEPALETNAKGQLVAVLTRKRYTGQHTGKSMKWLKQEGHTSIRAAVRAAVHAALHGDIYALDGELVSPDRESNLDWRDD